MMIRAVLVCGLTLVSQAAAVILQNGQVRITNFPDTKVASFNAASYKSYDANATEISYKGRWDSKKVSFWA
jgi:hypothetical protein